MSHTTEIKSVPIKDEKALKAAIKELQKQGVKCELLENATPRMYYPDQFKRSHGKDKADFVLKLHNSPYDVGFVAEYETNKRGKQVLKQFNMTLDTWGGHIAKEIGYGDVQGGDRNTAAVGKFSQLYTKHATVNAARKSGYDVRSAEYDKEGNLQLVLAQMY